MPKQSFFFKGLFQIAISLFLFTACNPGQTKNPITVTCIQPGPIPCTGSVDAQFTATHVDGKAITIAAVSVVATGPNSNCAAYVLLPDSDTRPEVLAQSVRVSCADCMPDQTITVVIKVVDSDGNANFAWCIITT